MAKVMEKKVKKPISKPKKPVSKPLDDASLKIETPYPKEEKAYRNSGKLPSLKSDDNYWGEKMVKLQDRINELELTVNDMHLKLGKVANRLGM